MSMTRSGYRNMILITLAGLMVLSIFVFMQGTKEEERIAEKQGQLTKLKQELENAARLSAALTELDQLTINEQTATQLDILRHLGLEQADINFSVESREIRTVGDSNLYVRTAKVGGALPYPAALYLADRLHNTKKIVLTEMSLEPIPESPGKVQMLISGKIYGLDKQMVPAQ